MVVDWVVVVVIYKDEDEMNPVVAWVVVISKADGYEERESKFWLGVLWLSLEAHEDDWEVEPCFDVIDGPGEALLLDT